MHAASLAVELGLHCMFSATPAPHLDSVPWSEELRLWGPDLREEGAERLERHAARVLSRPSQTTPRPDLS